MASGKLLLALSLVMCSSALMAATTMFHALSPDMASLEQYQWKKRPVIIFAPSEQDADYVRQMAILKQSQSALAERDIIVLSDTSPAARGQLRTRLRPGGFEVLLVGKDGGIKRRQNRPVLSGDLLATIDSMPMRKANLR
ncbi:DUF4174 domain-containing protein [Pantoea sp. KPR_PJ]